MKRALVLMLLLIQPTDASNAQVRQYHQIGSGVQSCGSWTAARRTNMAFTNMQWLLGFLSGVGFNGAPDEDDPLNGVDAEGVWGWIDNYCRTHPITTLAAAGAFYYAHPR